MEESHIVIVLMVANAMELNLIKQIIYYILIMKIIIIIMYLK